MAETFTSVEFRNYKALRNFSLSLTKHNILIGPNNCGKSTIIGAFRVLAEGIRKARSKSPENVWLNGVRERGYRIPPESIAISTENVHTNYEDVDTWVRFRLSNGNRLRLVFQKNGDCLMLPELERGHIGSPTTFRSAFPVTLAVVPVLGPLEHDEPRVEPATVQRNLHTTRASRNFRNYWHYYPDNFEQFAELIARTWPGMTISPPEDDGQTLHMFCNEDRIPRELYWSGFGFQIWCQLLTHLSIGREASAMVVDEPEIYLHPELQRQLLDIFFSLGPSIIMATHSAELIGPAEPKDVVLIDKRTRCGQRLATVERVQLALDGIGSIHNITLSRIARHRRVLFVEGKDYALLMRFAKIAGFPELSTGTGLPAVRSDGFATWTRIRDTAWGIRKILNGPFLMASVMDRDYRPAEQVGMITGELQHDITLTRVLEAKEIENYLLVPSAISRAVNAAVRREGRTAPRSCTTDYVERVIWDLTTSIESYVKSQYIGRRSEYLREQGDRRDVATVIEDTTQWFDTEWAQLAGRIRLCPGKDVIARLRDRFQQEFQVTLTTTLIVAHMRAADLAPDMTSLLQDLDEFRTAHPRDEQE